MNVEPRAHADVNAMQYGEIDCCAELDVAVALCWRIANKLVLFGFTCFIIGGSLGWDCCSAVAQVQVPAGQGQSDQVQIAMSRPEWIWSQAGRQDPVSVELRTSDRIEGSVHRADLRLAADYARCQLRIDGRDVLMLDDYGPWLDVDVTSAVQSGECQIELLCRGSQGPSAVLFELAITKLDGSRQFIRSGADWRARAVGSQSGAWTPVETFGAVAPEYWDADRSARITPFDNYEQWRQASVGSDPAKPAKLFVRPGFEIQHVRSATDQEGSWVSMEFDTQGRLIIAREDRGLLRMSLTPDGSSIGDVEEIDSTLQECRGLLSVDHSLYAQANNTKALYRLEDQDGDGEFEILDLLREFTGGVGHGRNDLALGPDGAIYSIYGDSVTLPDENVVDHTSPFRQARRGERTTEGHVLAFFPEDSRWHLLCSGLRNPFGIDFNLDGEAFTYDADAEFDMGSPWYRPTRLVHLVSGGDYGWRGRTGTWPPYDADHADFTLPAGDIGKGSPTAVKSGRRSSFPEHYRRAMFALDWAYGRILACHLVPRGAGYVCRAESFLKGQPLNVTDLDFGPDGSLYIITGGRKTHSDLYRIRWIGGQGIGGQVDAGRDTRQQQSRNLFSKVQRETRHRLSRLHHGDAEPERITEVWQWMGHPDPMLRDAARVAIENLPLDVWSKLAFQESRPAWIVSSMLSIARSNHPELIPAVFEKLAQVKLKTLSGYERSMLLETWSQCLANASAEASQTPAYLETVKRIDQWYPDDSVTCFAPTGGGRSVNHQLGLLACELDLPELVPKTLKLLSQSKSQEERMHALFVLRNRRNGWNSDSHRMVFETLGELDRTVVGGEGMPGFLAKIRSELVANLNEDQKASLGDLIQPGSEAEAFEWKVDRPIIKTWATTDMESLLSANSEVGDRHRGREVFHRVLCDRCHRAGGIGGVSGPDLSSIASRFGPRDILLSILEPSRVVDEKYRNEKVVTTDGRVIVGRLAPGGDYRATKIRISVDPLRPLDYVEVDKSDIETHQLSAESPMPTGLLNTLQAQEIRDLLAFLQQNE